MVLHFPGGCRKSPLDRLPCADQFLAVPEIPWITQCPRHLRKYHRKITVHFFADSSNNAAGLRHIDQIDQTGRPQAYEQQLYLLQQNMYRQLGLSKNPENNNGTGHNSFLVA
ncbi:hypothetical protein D3C74_424480 [compost metagenome]